LGEEFSHREFARLALKGSAAPNEQAQLQPVLAMIGTQTEDTSNGYSVYLDPSGGGGLYNLAWSLGHATETKTASCKVTPGRNRLGFLSAIGSSGKRVGMIAAPDGTVLGSSYFDIAAMPATATHMRLGHVIGTGTFNGFIWRSAIDIKPTNYLSLPHYHAYAKAILPFWTLLG
jgi:hypothetical protein